MLNSCWFALFCTSVYAVSIVTIGLLKPTGLGPNFTFPLAGYGHLLSRIQEADQKQDVDVIVLGSSHAYRGFDPRIFKEEGLTMFNLGSSSQTIIQSEYLLQRYLDSMKPKMVVLEVYTPLLESDGVECNLDLLANDGLNPATVQLSVQHPNLKILNAMIYSGFRRLFHLNDGLVQPAREGSDTYIPGGYVQKDLFTNTKFNSSPPKKIHINPKQWNSLDHIAQLLHKKNISLMLVMAPVTSLDYAAIANQQEIENKLSKLGVYWNFNRIMELNDSLHFYDQHHLNQKGVELFNRLFIDELKKNQYFNTKDSY